MGRTRRKRRLKPVKEYKSVEENETYVNLKKWMKRNGWRDEFNLKLNDFAKAGRGFISIKLIKENQIIMQVPYELMITQKAISKSEDFLKIIAPNSKLQFHDLLSLFIIYEKHKSRNSFWKFYIDTLPQETPTLPMFSTPEEIDILPHELKLEVLKSRRKLEESFLRINKSILPTWTCVCCKKSSASVFPFDLYAWAYAMVNTRAVYVDPQINSKDLCFLLSDVPCMALCPLLDMFNHSNLAKTNAELVVSNGRMVFQLRALNSCQKYDQVFISYGCHDNTKLLCEYGFFVAGNSLDRVGFVFKDVLVVLGVDVDKLQYKFITSKNFDKDLYVGCLGPSFNLKALFYVVLEPEIVNWSANIYSQNYSGAILEGMQIFLKILLGQKIDAFNEILDNFRQKVNNLSEYGRVLASYVAYLRDFSINLGDNSNFD